MLTTGGALYQIAIFLWIGPLLFTSSLKPGIYRTGLSGDDLIMATNYEQSKHQQMGIENNTVTNATAQIGSKAFLHCIVKNKGDIPQVSWIRKRDWHILTSGIWTYTNDERFQILHQEGTNDWTLQIKYVQQRDNGTYECQVTSGKGTISHLVNLDIVSSQSFIVGSGEHHVDASSVINLVCIIESPSPPQYVFWYHNERMINYDTGSGITVETEPGPRTQSRLIISNARFTDSGNYTCSASNASPASILVFVSQGSDQLAAVHRPMSSAAHLHNFMKIHIVILIIYTSKLLALS